MSLVRLCMMPTTTTPESSLSDTCLPIEAEVVFAAQPSVTASARQVGSEGLTMEAQTDSRKNEYLLVQVLDDLLLFLVAMLSRLKCRYQNGSRMHAPADGQQSPNTSRTVMAEVWPAGSQSTSPTHQGGYSFIHPLVISISKHISRSTRLDLAEHPQRKRN